MRDEKLYKRREVRERLNITKYGYNQLIAEGILAAPIRLTKTGHPFHTESQLIEAERKIYKKANPDPTPNRKTRSRGMSKKLFDQIREEHFKK